MLFACKTCPSLRLCYKCYGNKESLYPSQEWESFGSEFAGEGANFTDEDDYDKNGERIDRVSAIVVDSDDSSDTNSCDD